MISKEEQQAMKTSFDELHFEIRCEPTKEPKKITFTMLYVNSVQIWKKIGLLVQFLHVNIRQIWQWHSTRATCITDDNFFSCIWKSYQANLELVVYMWVYYKSVDVEMDDDNRIFQAWIFSGFSRFCLIK